MNSLGKKFEDVIVRTILKDERLVEAGFKTYYVTTSPTLRDPGYDFTWSFEKDGKKYNYAIELCTTRTVESSKVDKLIRILSSIEREFNGAAIVFTGEVSQETVTLASSYNILLIPVTETEKEDWKDRIKDININMTMNVPSIFDFQINFNKEDSKRALSESQRESYSISFTEDPRKIPLLNKDGVSVSSLSDLINTYVGKTDQVGVTEIRHSFTEATYLKTEIGSIQLDSVDFKIKIEAIKKPINVSGETQEFQFAFSIIRHFLRLGSIPTLRKSIATQ